MTRSYRRLEHVAHAVVSHRRRHLVTSKLTAVLTETCFFRRSCFVGSRRNKYVILLVKRRKRLHLNPALEVQPPCEGNVVSDEIGEAPGWAAPSSQSLTYLRLVQRASSKPSHLPNDGGDSLPLPQRRAQRSVWNEWQKLPDGADVRVEVRPLLSGLGAVGRDRSRVRPGLRTGRPRSCLARTSPGCRFSLARWRCHLPFRVLSILRLFGLGTCLTLIAEHGNAK